METEVYESFGLHRNFTDEHGQAVVNGRRNLEILDALDTEGDVGYEPCAEALAEATESGPTSAVTHFDDWRSGQVYPGTTRNLWILAPDALGSEDRPGVLVFNDGGSYLDPDGPIRAQRVLDALRVDDSLPPVVGVFISPGRPLDVAPTDGPYDMNIDPAAQRQRSIEYDSMTATYASMLVDEVLPFVGAELGVQFSEDPARRGIVGISSGGICSWTAAWHRPDAFGLVLSHCGSFVNIRGGHSWPYLIRSNERRPIRVFLQSGSSDANIIFGSWPLANQQVAAALEFAGYDMRFEFGTGGHNLRHGGALFAESLRWLFRDREPQLG